MMDKITAILLAAGESRRMGQPKLLLPWGGTTVLGQVVSTFAGAGVNEILVVTGGNRELVENLLAELAGRFPVRAIHNPDHAHGGMLSSIRCGIGALALSPGDSGASAALIGLGDQPQVREETVRRICTAFLQNHKPLVVPSFENRRGHPWLAARSLWETIQALPASITARQFLTAHDGSIEYVEADETILQDLDTPEDYSRHRP